MNPASRFLNQFGLKLITYPKTIGLMTLSLVFLLAAGILQVQVVGSVGNIFNPQSKYVIEFEEFIEQFGALEREIIIVIEADDILSETTRNEISNLHLELEFLDDIISVISIASLRDSPNASPNIGQIIADDNFAKYGAKAIQQKLYEHPLAQHRLISKDGKKTVMLLGLKASENLTATLGSINQKARKLAAQEIKSGKYYFTGFLAVSAEIVTAILQDQIFFVVAGAILGLIFGYLFFRHFTLIMATAIPSILSILLVLGAMGWLGIGVNVMTNVVPTIIMVIAFADAMHMVDAMRYRLERGETAQQAVLYALRVVGPACVFTSATTSVAFLSLTFANTPIVAEFGRAASVGTFLALIASVGLSSLIVLGLNRIFPVKPLAQAEYRNGIVHHKMSVFSGFMARLAIGHAKKIVSIGFIILIAATYLHLQNDPEYRYSENLPDNNPASYAIDVIDKDLGGIDSFYFVLSRKDGAAIDFDDKNISEILQQFNQMIADEATFTSVASVSQLSRWLAKDENNLPSINSILDSLPAAITSRFVTKARDKIIISVFTPDLGAATLKPFLHDVRQRAENIIKHHGEYKFLLTGLAAMSAEESHAMIGELNNGLLFAMVIIILFMGIVFRSSFYAFASILPNLMPIVAGGALLYIIADGLQFTTIIALTIAFGIAVDDSVHFLYQYRQNRKKHNAAISIEKTLTRIGPVLMATTFMLSAGLGLMFFSNLPQMSLFGMIVIFILNVALLADIAILPSIFYMKDKEKTKTS